MFRTIDENEKIYKKVMEQIQELVLSGELKEGDKLPPERKLAEMLQVGRPALQQALCALEALGIIQSRHGDGNYITQSALNIFNPLAIRFYLDRGDLDNILEFRYMLEVQLAKLAAVKICDTQIEQLEKTLNEMKTAKTVEERVTYNARFHTWIVGVSSNSLIESIYDSILSLIAYQVSLTDGRGFYESHEKIFLAIKNRDPESAALHMAEHFELKFPNYKYYGKLRRL